MNKNIKLINNNRWYNRFAHTTNAQSFDYMPDYWLKKPRMSNI
jgi:hypothetical protein